MYPVINLFGKEIGTYGLMAVIGIVLVGFLLCLSLRHRGMDDNNGIIFLLFVAGGVLIGGHLLYGLTNLRYFPYFLKVTSFQQFMTLLSAVFGGAVFYGGLIGGAISGLLYLKVAKQSIPLYTDLMAPLIPLFHSFARVGCFLGGCCYGIECDFGFIAHGNHLVEAVNGVSRFQVYRCSVSCTDRGTGINSGSS